MSQQGLSQGSRTGQDSLLGNIRHSSTELKSILTWTISAQQIITIPNIMLKNDKSHQDVLGSMVCYFLFLLLLLINTQRTF